MGEPGDSEEDLSIERVASTGVQSQVEATMQISVKRFTNINNGIADRVKSSRDNDKSH